MLLKYFCVRKRQPNPQLIIIHNKSNQFWFIAVSIFIARISKFTSQSLTLSFNYNHTNIKLLFTFFIFLYLFTSSIFFDHKPWLRASDELMSYAMAPTNSTMNDKKKCGVSPITSSQTLKWVPIQIFFKSADLCLHNNKPPPFVAVVQLVQWPTDSNETVDLSQG